MSNVVEFQTPAQLRKLLQERDDEILALKAQISNLSSVKEMLTIQTLDLQGEMTTLVDQMQRIQQNLGNLLKKLAS